MVLVEMPVRALNSPMDNITHLRFDLIVDLPVAGMSSVKARTDDCAPTALDVLQDLTQRQPSQLKGFLDGHDTNLLSPCGKPPVGCLWRREEEDVVAERHPNFLDRFQPLRGWLWDDDGDHRAGGLVARRTLRRDRQPDDLPGGRAQRRNLGGLLEHEGQEQRVPGAPGGQSPAVDGEAVWMLVLRQPGDAHHIAILIPFAHLVKNLAGGILRDVESGCDLLDPLRGNRAAPGDLSPHQDGQPGY